jgi:cytochrome P450
MTASTLTPAQRPTGPVLTRFFPPALLYHLRTRPLEFLTSVAQQQQQQEVVHLGWAGWPTFFVTTPDLVKEMLLNTQQFEKGIILKKLEVIIGKGLITLNGDAWRDARRRMQSVFHRHLLQEQQGIVVRHTRQMIDRLQSEAAAGPVNLDRVMNELTFNIALELFVGAGPDMVEDHAELQAAIDNLNAYAKWRTWAFTSEHRNTRRNREFRKALAVLENIVEKVLAARRGDTAQASAARCDVLSLLLNAGFEGQPLRDHVMTMLIAGHETTGTALAFLWAHVARDVRVQNALYEEARCTSDDAIALEAIPFTDAVWKETLRLYPSVPVLDRFAKEEVRLGDYRIPARSNVLWSPYVMHRSKSWWPHRSDPNAFDPWAFLNDPPPAPGAYIPFGEGPRMCLGKSLADMEALTVVSMFTRAFALESTRSDAIRTRTLVTLRPEGGVPVRLTPRLQGPSPLPIAANFQESDYVAC